MTRRIGLIGLGTMGRALALNLRDHGLEVIGFDSEDEARAAFVAAGAGLAPSSLPDLIAALPSPRVVLILVPAGAAVDRVMDALRPLLAAGDVVADCGNSHYGETVRRCRSWAVTGLHWLGVGVSGGESGARHGPAMMAGGGSEALDRIEPLLAPSAAMSGAGRCFGRFGGAGAGHFVKMVHNGIEYAEMQLIAEACLVLRRHLGLSAAATAALFAEWAAGDQGSYLLEISAAILAEIDTDSGKPLLDLVADAAEQKGTGHWTVTAAAELGVAAPTIAAAVNARLLSAALTDRAQVRDRLAPVSPAGSDCEVAQVGEALLAARLCAFAQGIAVLRAARRAFGWDLDPAEAVRVWSGGCIIRTRLLAPLAEAMAGGGEGVNLLALSPVAGRLATADAGWRRVVAAAAFGGLPVPALASALAYRDGLASARPGTELIQAQRDCFGAHGYGRIDRPGRFHSTWGVEP